MTNNLSSRELTENIHEALYNLKIVLSEIPLVQYQYKNGFISHWYFLQRVYYMAEIIDMYFSPQVDNNGGELFSHYYPNDPQKKLHKSKIHRALIRNLLHVTKQIIIKLRNKASYDSYDKSKAIALSNSLFEHAKLIASEVFGQTVEESRQMYLTIEYSDNLISILEEVKRLIKQYNSTTKLDYSFFAFLLKFQATNCNNMLHYMINKDAKFQKLLVLQKLQTVCEYIKKYSISNDEIQGFNARESISRALELKRALENLIAFIDPRYPFP